MAKALINKGIPIKADDPKDPYIRDENGIKDIVDSSTVFGKTLGTANGKIQLKNGDTVLSEQDIFSLYESTDPTIDPGYYQIDTSTYPYPTIPLWGRSLLVGEFYKLEVVNNDFSAFGIVQAVEENDSSITFTINCSGVEEVIYTSEYLYIQVDSINGSEYVCTGYKELPGEHTYYERPIKVGDNLSIENNTLKATQPDISHCGKTLAISGQDLSLKNGDAILSTVTLPSGGGGSSAGVSTYTANFSSGNAYQLASSAVATEIYDKLNNNEDVQIALVKNGSKHIARCFGYFKGIMEEDEWSENPCYYFSCIVDDLPLGSLLIETFDLYSGNVTLAITSHNLSNLSSNI